MHNYEYKLIRSKRRTLAIHINELGEVIVKAPNRLPDTYIKDFLTVKSEWILKALEKSKVQNANRKVHNYQSGDKFLYLGNEYELIIDVKATQKVKFKNGFITCHTSKEEIRKQLVKWYKNKAREIFEVKLMSYANINSFNYVKMRITGAKTRWGSCSTSGTISLNWKLIMAPVDILDYVIIHELAHTVQHDHSDKFWKVVENILPDYLAKRKWLKTNGYLFTL